MGLGRTIVDSIAEVTGPPADEAALATQLQSVRARHPGAVVERYLGQIPTIAADVYLAPGAAVVGAVRIAEHVSVWFGCVLRGDVNTIEVRERSNVQDGAVVHVGDEDPTLIAEEVVVGHRAVVHGCRIGGGALIGIGAIVLDGAVIGHGSIVAAAALVPAGTVVPPRSVVMGVPGKVVRTLTAADEAFHRALAGKYTRLAHNYRVG